MRRDQIPQVSPCLYCEHTERCRYFELACSAFVGWINEEDNLDGRDRKPSRKIYDEVFAQD